MSINRANNNCTICDSLPMSSGIIASTEHVAGSCRNYHATAAWTNSALNAKLNRARREFIRCNSCISAWYGPMREMADKWRFLIYSARIKGYRRNIRPDAIVSLINRKGQELALHRNDIGDNLMMVTVRVALLRARSGKRRANERGWEGKRGEGKGRGGRGRALILTYARNVNGVENSPTCQ